MGQEKSNHVHALTLCFRDSLKEEQVSPFEIHRVLFYYFQCRELLLELFFSSFSTNGMRTAVSAVPWLAVWSFSSFWAASSWPFCPSNAHSSSPVSDGFRLDGRLAHDVIGRSSPMAPLGCDVRLRFPAGHFYYRPLMRRRPSQLSYVFVVVYLLFLSSPVL